MLVVKESAVSSFFVLIIVLQKVSIKYQVTQAV